MLLAVFELLSRQLPLFFEATLDLAQLPLCLQQFSLQLDRVKRKLNSVCYMNLPGLRHWLLPLYQPSVRCS